MFRHDGAESGKQDRILACLVGTVHAQEATQSIGQLVPVGGHILQGSGCLPIREFGCEFPPAFVLSLQGVYQANQLFGLAEAWKQVIFLEFLVVLLDKSRTMSADPTRIEPSKGAWPRAGADDGRRLGECD